MLRFAHADITRAFRRRCRDAAARRWRAFAFMRAPCAAHAMLSFRYFSALYTHIDAMITADISATTPFDAADAMLLCLRAASCHFFFITAYDASVAMR